LTSIISRDTLVVKQLSADIKQLSHKHKCCQWLLVQSNIHLYSASTMSLMHHCSTSCQYLQNGNVFSWCLKQSNDLMTLNSPARHSSRLDQRHWTHGCRRLTVCSIVAGCDGPKTATTTCWRSDRRTKVTSLGYEGKPILGRSWWGRLHSIRLCL